MAATINQEGANEAQRHPTPWFGRYTDKKWFCECNRRAKYLTCSNNGPNHGKRFLTCPKGKESEDQCPFFIWMDQEAEAIEWIEKNRPHTVPETPKGKNSKIIEPPTPNTSERGLSKELETPFTLAKRKRVFIGDSEEQKDNYSENQNLNGGQLGAADIAKIDTSSRKAAKTAVTTTPGQTSPLKGEATATSIPTPDSDDKAVGDVSASEREARRSIEGSPTPIQRNRKRRGKPSDLTVAILNLLQTHNVALRESTKTRIRQEIELEMVSNNAQAQQYRETIAELSEKLDDLETTSEAELQRHKETVSRLSKKITDLESTIEQLTAGGAMDDVVELSD